MAKKNKLHNRRLQKLPFTSSDLAFTSLKEMINIGKNITGKTFFRIKFLAANCKQTFLLFVWKVLGAFLLPHHQFNTTRRVLNRMILCRQQQQRNFGKKPESLDTQSCPFLLFCWLLFLFLLFLPIMMKKTLLNRVETLISLQIGAAVCGRLHYADAAFPTFFFSFSLFPSST